MSKIKTCLIYGTESGNTEDVAKKNSSRYGKNGYDVDIYDVKNAEPDEYLKYNFLIMGIPTWEYGGVQENWENFEKELLEMDFKRIKS